MSFQIKGITVGTNALKSGTVHDSTIPVLSYQPNWSPIAKGIGLNTLRLSQGAEGEVWGTYMPTNPDWADNFEALLATIDAGGFKCFWQDLGTPWYGNLGILTPEGSYYDWQTNTQSIPMDIATAKGMIDQVAGNNTRRHNFITDPRILLWSFCNEMVLGTVNDDDTVTPNSAYYWMIEMADHIRSKGGKVVIPSPRVWHNGGSWESSFRFTVPLLEGHVDYLEMHWYGCSELYNLCNLGGDNYDWELWKTYARAQLQDMVNYKGSFPVDRVFLGEFGIWRGGPSTDVGLTEVTFTDKNRIDYFTNYFQVINEVGLKNVNIHYGFDDALRLSNNPYLACFALVSTPQNGSVLYPCTEVVRANFAPSALPFKDNFADIYKFTPINGSWSAP